MKLPDGRTCGDCIHVRRCVLFGFTKSENTNCDFSPSRYQQAEERVVLLTVKGKTEP